MCVSSAFSPRSHVFPNFAVACCSPIGFPLKNLLKLVLWPVRLVGRLALSFYYRYLREPCGKLWVVDLNGNCEWGEFRDQIDRAMQFIREHDPRRAARIEQHVHYIVNTSMFHNSSGVYSQLDKACWLNYESLYERLVGWGDFCDDTQQVLTLKLASTIVHEATHARIDDAGIPYDERHRERIERACLREELHFMRRAADNFHDACGQPMDWAKEYDFEQSRDYYTESWAKSKWHHLQEDVRNAWKKHISDAVETAAASWREQHRLCWDYTSNCHPWALSTLYTRGCIHAMANNHALAADDFRKVLERDPELVEARSGLAAQLFYASRYDEALAIWTEAHARGQEDAAGWISVTLFRLNRAAEALEWLDRDASDGDSTERIGFRALLLMELGQRDEAIDSFRRAVKEQPVVVGSKEFTYLAMQARLLQGIGREIEYQATLRELKSAIERWCQASDVRPVETAAYILPTSKSMHCSGDGTRAARLLVCPDATDSPNLRRDLERIAGLLLAKTESDSQDYEDVYLRSLLSTNDNYQWREVPENLTDGRRLWVIDLTLDRILLPDGRLHDNWVSCSISRSGSAYSACLSERSFDDDMKSKNE